MSLWVRRRMSQGYEGNILVFTKLRDKKLVICNFETGLHVAQASLYFLWFNF